MPRISRRRFIYSTGIWGIASFTPATLKHFMTLPDEWIWAGKSPHRGQQTAAVVGVNPATLETRRIELGFLPHEVAVSPTRSAIAVVTMKWGQPGAIIDLDKQKVLGALTSPDKTQFYGHAVWSDDGETFYCVAHNEVNQKGEILAYSTKTFSLVNRIELTGGKPHQIRKSEEKNQVIVINKTSPVNTSRIDFVNIASGRVTKSQDLQPLSFYHFAYSTHQKRVLAGGYTGQIPFLGQSLLASLNDHEVQEIEIPKVDSEPVKGETLSLNLGTVGGREVLALTIAGGKFFALYDIQKNKFLQTSNSFVAPMGIDFSKRSPNILYVSDSGGDIHIFDISQGPFRLLKTLALGDGSHLTVA